MNCYCIAPHCHALNCTECNCTITEQERDVMRHALTGGTSSVYRNVFAAEPGHDDLPAIVRLVNMTLMRRGRSDGAMTYYHCTALGAAAVHLHLPER